MQPSELCEVCGENVSSDDVYRAQVTVDDLICPAPMAFHRACYELATKVLQPSDDYSCGVDPEYPETAQWGYPPAPGNAQTAAGPHLNPEG